jgi:hypothetical protein
MNIDAHITQALELNKGESLWTLCENLKQAQSLKVKYWRAIKAYKERTKIDPFIMISVREQKNEIFLVLTKQSFFPGSFLMTKDGVKVPLEKLTIDPDKERMIRLMREDGLSQEETLSHFQDLNEKEKDLIEELFNPPLDKLLL